MVLAVALGALALAACGSDFPDPATAVLAAATIVPPAATAVPTTAPTDTVAAHYNACASNGSGHECARPNGSANGGTHSNSGAGHRLLGVRIYPQPRLGSRRAVTGYSESAPSETQGLASFVYSGVTVGLVWSPSNFSAPLEFMAASYNDIQAAQPGISFESIFGANTAFDELANLADLGAALEQDGNSMINDGVFDLFGGSLFGFK